MRNYHFFINIIILTFFISSCASTKKCNESQLYEHYIGFTHLKYSLLIDKMDSTYVYFDNCSASVGIYKEYNDTIHLCIHLINTY